MDKKVVAVDIDGVLRNLHAKMDEYLEIDYPDKVQLFRDSDHEYRALDIAFGSRNKACAWLFNERVFQIYGTAPKMHHRVIDDLNILINTGKKKGYKFVISSVQRDKSIPATLHWLSKHGCKITEYNFHENQEEKWNWNVDHADWIIDDHPIQLENFIKYLPSDRAIKVPYEYNKHINCEEIDIENSGIDQLYEIIGLERVLKVVD